MQFARDFRRASGILVQDIFKTVPESMRTSECKFPASSSYYVLHRAWHVIRPWACRSSHVRVLASWFIPYVDISADNLMLSTVDKSKTMSR